MKIKLKDTDKKENFISIIKDLKWGTSKPQLDFNTYIPYPKEYEIADKAHNDWYKENTVDHHTYGKLKEGIDDKSCPKDGFNNGGYDWCCKNWGTKWNAGDIEVFTDHSEFGYIEFFFETAWAPPFPVIMTMSEKYNGIEFETHYQIEGVNGGGDFKIYNGKIASISHIEPEEME